MYIWSKKKTNNWVLPFLKNETKIFFSFPEYILFTLDEGFDCWILDEGVKNKWTNILILKFIIPQIIYSVLIKI